MPTSRRSSRRPYLNEHVPVDISRARGGSHVETASDGEWAIRRVNSPEKSYHCPGCNQPIPPTVNHVVAWRRDGWQGEEAGLAERRHWHPNCWARRK